MKAGSKKPGLALAAAAALGLGSLKKLPAQAAPPARPGYVDPQKLVEASERLQQLIESENKDHEERLKKLEETSAKLKKSVDTMIEAVAAPKRQQAQQEADWRKQGCPVTQPLTVGKPLKLKKRMP